MRLEPNESNYVSNRTNCESRALVRNCEVTAGAVVNAGEPTIITVRFKAPDGVSSTAKVQSPLLMPGYLVESQIGYIQIRIQL